MNTRFKENVQKLFEFWCEIAPTSSNEKVSGIIVESFPENFKDPEIIAKIPEFAYPCRFSNESVQTYSFVLTSTDSKWRFGFCRHDVKTETAMVIITYLPWHDIFVKFLNVLGELKRTAPDEFQPFLAEAYAKGVPEPGACLKLYYNAGLNSFIFQRPSQFQLPSIPENQNLNLYYNFVDPKNMIAVFAAMLAERRIIFSSKRLDKLSCCVQAANAFLYPMVWQHIFVPILPLKMKEILCAPMPYLIGVPEAVLETVTREELGEVVILNCDNKHMETPFDDVKNIPAELVSQLKKQLSNPHEHMGDRVSKIFLGILVQLIGGYRDAIKFTQGEKITWDPETFIESRPSHLRAFLRNMLELQIFQQFIEERLEMLNTGLGFSDEFELETLRHLERSGKKGRHYKEFLKNVKDKTNPAVKSAVQSVKQGSRGVKIAYKDLKSKLSDRTSPKSSKDFSNPMFVEQHHSAPTSPVFPRKTQTESSPTSTTMIQTASSLTTYSSNSNFSNNMKAERPISPSPTSSASSSSSEMNILKELQQHALFKSPAVNRNLKPTTSYDTNKKLSRRGSLVDVPFSNRTPSHDQSRSPVCLLDGISDSLENSSDNDAMKSNSSSFDVPPNTLPPEPPKSFLYRNVQRSPQKSIQSTLIDFESASVKDQTYHEQVSYDVPVITPKFLVQQKTNRIPQDQTKDLIQLDSLHSTGIEDFDPLKNPNLLSNNNAQKTYQAPSSSYNLQNANHHQTSTSPASSSSSVNRKTTNPLLPYFPSMPKTMQERKTDSDMELLRKYGLDNLKLNDNQHRMTTTNVITTTASSTSGAFIPNANITNNNNINNNNNFNKFDTTDNSNHGLHQTAAATTTTKSNKYQWTTFD